MQSSVTPSERRESPSALRTIGMPMASLGKASENSMFTGFPPGCDVTQ